MTYPLVKLVSKGKTPGLTLLIPSAMLEGFLLLKEKEKEAIATETAIAFGVGVGF